MRTQTTLAWYLAGFVLMAAPLWAGEPESFDPEQPFQSAISSSVLRSLLNQALDEVENFLELSTELTSEEMTGNRQGRLQLKVYPEGKRKSNQHFLAEGWFHLGPGHTLRDFSLRFQNPAPQNKPPSLLPDDIL